MDRSPNQLRADALAIWCAGVRAVHGFRLVTEHLVIDDHWLGLPEQDLWINLETTGRIFVAGAGKATAAMARGVAHVLANQPTSRLAGHLQIPEDADFETSAAQITGAIDLRDMLFSDEPTAAVPEWLQLHQVRPAGSNFITDTAVAQTQELCQKLRALGPDDVCLFLLSGGASALLSDPVTGISIADKNQVTRCLSAWGAPIEELNIVRSALSRVKAGGLARLCGAGRLLTLILSDVLGDPLPSIGSGPTFCDDTSPSQLAQRALAVLQSYDSQRRHLPALVYDSLQRQVQQSANNSRGLAGSTRAKLGFAVLGNTATAVDAAGMEAERRGYSHAMHIQPPRTEVVPYKSPEAESSGRRWATLLSEMNGSKGPDCLIVGGESIVDLDGVQPDSRGGRNQHLGLATFHHWQSTNNPHWLRDEICLVSGGTDGEDGNTTVAGVCLSADLRASWPQPGLDTQTFLKTKNSYNFFRQSGGLLITGNTQTNVCDLQVGVVRQHLTDQVP